MTDTAGHEGGRLLVDPRTPTDREPENSHSLLRRREGYVHRRAGAVLGPHFTPGLPSYGH